MRKILAALFIVFSAVVCSADSIYAPSPIAPYISAGSWTPTDASGASLVFTSVNAKYTQIGNMVFAYASLTYPATVSTANASIGGLPIAVPNQTYAQQCLISYTNASTLVHMTANANTTTTALWLANGTNVLNSALTGAVVIFECIYPVS